MSIYTDLQRREQAGSPIRAAVVGTGYMGAGMVRRMNRIPGLRAAVAANRTLSRAVDALRSAGMNETTIRVCTSPGEADAALRAGLSVATSDLSLPAQLEGIEVIVEATGDVLVGAEVALSAIRGGKHLVASNAETHATVGPILKYLADQAGVVYSDVYGDQPGLIKELYDYCVALGLEPIVGGNCKGVLKRYATPATQAAFAAANNLKPWLASAAADGTKLCFEMALVADATGMLPVTRGMTGPQTSLETLVEDFERLGLLDQGPIVEYSLGIPSGVFLVFRGDDPELQSDLRYLKMGEGPYYLLYRPHVLIHYEAPLSVAEAALYNAATITPLGAPVAEVCAFAKQDVAAGEHLDGIGGFHTYGLIVSAEEAARDRLVPMGLVGHARLRRAIAKDQPLTYDDIEFDGDNFVMELRRKQEELFSAALSNIA